MSELNSYIDSLSSAGERQGSEGQFTIDPFKSQKKLQLFHPELLSSKAPICREFQLGLSAAQALQPRRVVFRSLYGGLESLPTVTDGNPTSSHRTVEDDGTDFNEVRIEKARVPFSTSLYELLAERCSYCPRVAWMGRRLIRKSPPDTAGRLFMELPTPKLWIWEPIEGSAGSFQQRICS